MKNVLYLSELTVIVLFFYFFCFILYFSFQIVTQFAKSCFKMHYMIIITIITIIHFYYYYEYYYSKQA